MGGGDAGWDGTAIGSDPFVCRAAKSWVTGTIQC